MAWFLRLTGGCVLILALAAPAALADVVYLKNGKKFEGAAEDRGDTVVLRLERGSITFPKDDVDRIEKKANPWEVYEQKARELKPDDAAGHLGLAKWCRANGLGGRAEKEIAAVLKADPENAEAHTLLGHEKFEGKWLTPEEVLKARGFTQVEGVWLGPKEYAAYKARKETEEKLKAAVEAEKAHMEALADPDKDKAAAGRKHYLDQGEGALQNLCWAVKNFPKSAVRLEAAKLINQIGVPQKSVCSAWLAEAASHDENKEVVAEVCRGIKARKDDTALTLLVYQAAAENAYRRRAAAALRLINDTRAYRSLIGCLAGQPTNTLPGMGGMSVSSLGQMAARPVINQNGPVLFSQPAMDAGEVLPAADSLECISGRDFRNDVAAWLKWVDELERAPGGAVIDTGKGK